MRRALIGLSLLLSQLTHAQSTELPAALEPWRAWVEHAHPDLRCPLLQGVEQKVCAWPGRFEFSVDQQRAVFSGSVQAYADSDFPLPGSTSQWPEQVEVDGKAVAVTAGPNGPQIRLAAGRSQVSGSIEFVRRPEEITLPAAYALLGLQLDGAAVEQPRRTPGGLWLGRVQNETSPQADSLSVEVYRLLSDNSPPLLTTVIRLNVAGRAREQRLTGVLPGHFTYTDLRSPLNTRLDGDDLVLQLRPGTFELGVDARATQVIEQVGPSAAIEPWPAEEIWSYAANPALRESSASAATPIDPAQADVPEGWRAYASFLLSADQPLTLNFGNRGIAGDAPNRLTLQRRLWLSFDAQRWLAKDQISGQMSSGWRLDTQPPFLLTRASSQGEPVLVTRAGERTGVELRSPYVNVEAGAEAAFGGPLPATGWASDFESASVQLELPPGWRLLHLGGADRTSGTWSSRIGLLQIGVLAVVAVVAWALGSWLLALLLLVVGVLGLGEADLPLLTLAGVLALIGVLVRLPQGRKRHLGTLAGWLALALASLSCVPFLWTQTSLAVFPQLERYDLSGYQPPEPMGGNDGAMVAQESMAMAPPPPPPPMPASVSAPVMQDNMMEKSRGRTAGSQVKRSLERYSAGTNVQAGNADPDWHWNGHVAQFDGRVSAATELRPWLLSPTLNLLWRLASVAGVLLVLGLLARLLLRRGSLPTGQRWLLVSASLLCVPTLHAAELPDSEWLERIEQRLLEPEQCRASGCASMPRASVQVDGAQLTVVLDSHAQARTALPVPELGERHWGAALIDGQAAHLQHYNGQTWLVIEPGIHRVELRAAVDRSSQLRLRFSLLPARVSCAATAFVCSGISEGRLQSDTLELTPEASETTGTASAPTRSAIPAFVRIERDFSFELDWDIQTTVFRIAPQTGGLTIRVPLQPGEQLLTEGLEDTDGAVNVSLRSGEDSFTFSSRIAPVSSLDLVAAPWQQYSEVWRLRPGPAWRLEFSGVPAVEPPSGDSEWVHSFYPLPGETLHLQLSRPAAAAGSTLAIDQLSLNTTAGARQRDSNLRLTLRATQGGQHRVDLPRDAELTAVLLDGRPLNLRLTDGALSVPVRPGAQNLQVDFRENLAPTFRQSLPVIDVHAPASNVRMSLVPAAERWLLWTAGPALGPALGYWLLLAVALLAVVLLQWLGLLPVSLISGLLLAAGAAFAGWWMLPLLLVLATLLSWQRRGQSLLRPWATRLLLLACVLLVVIGLPLVALGWLAAVTGTPDLHLGGLNSSSSGLHWFADLSEGALPQVTVWSAPLWMFRGLLLLWGIWLAWTLYGWLRSSVRGLLQSPPWRRASAAGAATRAAETADPELASRI